jgi:hypothetical protein
MNREESHRIIVTLPGHVHVALKRISAAEGVPMAAIMRYALVEWMRGQGIKVRDDIVWGGARYVPPKDDEAEPGQPVAVA